jgi:glutathione S-transferase
MKLSLYGVAISPFSLRVMMQIEAKGLQIQLLPPPGGLGSAQYADINPMRKIPALAIDDVIIPESEVICDLIEAIYPEPAMWPNDPVARAKARVIARIADIYVMNAMLPIFANLDPATRDTAVVDRALAAVDQGLRWLDKFIAPGPFAFGDILSLADCAAVPILAYVERFPPVFGMTTPFEGKTNLASYWQAIQHQAVASHAIKSLDDALASY